MSSNLPPGVTDSMLEPRREMCAACGHFDDEHYDDEHYEDDRFACDINGCECEGFVEGEYEPDVEDDD